MADTLDTLLPATVLVGGDQPSKIDNSVREVALKTKNTFDRAANTRAQVHLTGELYIHYGLTSGRPASPKDGELYFDLSVGYLLQYMTSVVSYTGTCDLNIDASANLKTVIGDGTDFVNQIPGNGAQFYIDADGVGDATDILTIDSDTQITLAEDYKGGGTHDNQAFTIILQTGGAWVKVAKLADTAFLAEHHPTGAHKIVLGTAANRGTLIPNPLSGQIYFSTDTLSVSIYNVTAWLETSRFITDYSRGTDPANLLTHPTDIFDITQSWSSLTPTSYQDSNTIAQKVWVPGDAGSLVFTVTQDIGSSTVASVFAWKFGLYASGTLTQTAVNKVESEYSAIPSDGATTDTVTLAIPDGLKGTEAFFAFAWKRISGGSGSGDYITSNLEVSASPTGAIDSGLALTRGMHWIK